MAKWGVKKPIVHLLLAFLLLFLSLSVAFPYLLWDEASYLSNAKSFIGEKNYFEDVRPPALPWLVGAFWLITGKSLLVAKLITIALTLFCIYMFYRITEFYFKKSRIFLTALFGLSPLILYWGFRLYTDIASIAFVLLAFYWIKKERHTLAGAATVVAALFRFITGIFGVAVVLAFLLKKEWKNSGDFIIGGLIAAAPWLVYNSLVYNNPIYDLQRNIITTEQWTSSVAQPFYLQLANLALILGPFLIPLAIGAIAFFRKWKQKDRLLILTYLVIFVAVFFFFVHVKLSRYWITILPFLYILVWQGVEKINLKKSIKYLFLVLSAIVILLPSMIVLQADNLCSYPVYQSISWTKERISANDTIISDFWPYFGFYTEARVSSPWKDVNSLIEELKPKYVIVQGYEDFQKNLANLSLPLIETYKNSCAQIKIYGV